MRAVAPRLWPLVAVLCVPLLVSTAGGVDVSDVSVNARLLTADGGPLEEGHRLKLGEQVLLEIEAVGPENTTFFVPSNPSLEPFRLVGAATPPVKTEVGGRVTERHRLLVVPLRVGAKAIAPMEIPYRIGDGVGASVSTDRRRVRIAGNLDNEQDPAMGAAPAPVPVIATNWWMVWGLSLLGGALFATLCTLLVLRLLRDRLEALRPGPPPPPADQVALAALMRLETTPMESVERYAAACDVLRAYLGGRYLFDGLELTTAEMMRSLEGADLKAVGGAEIQDLLSEADLVKFARLVPGEPEARRLIEEVRRIVLSTWEPPEEPEDEGDSLPPLDPADPADRLKAALLDVLLASAVALVVLGGLWVAALEAWAWLALVIAGLLLMLRDLSGRSPGKIWVGLEIIRPGARHGVVPTRSLLSRNVTLLLPPLGLPAELLVMFAHPLGLRLGDQWAGTDVVNLRSRGPR